MRVALLTFILGFFLVKADAQCDIATSGIAVLNASATAPVSQICVGKSANLRFTVANLGTDPSCVIPVGSVRVTLSFPSASASVKPYIYNGPASFSSGKFTWTYNSTSKVLVGINSGSGNTLAQYEGDEVTVPVLGNQGGVFSAPVNITQLQGVSDNIQNNTASASLTVNALPTASISYSGSPYCPVGSADRKSVV